MITPNPKTSGGAHWNFLAAWDWANTKFGGDEQKNIDFVTDLYKHVPVLDSGARGSTTTFVQRGIGDVLLAWENEAFLAVNELGPDQFDIVVPPTSIKAEPPVALVDKNVDEKGTREVAAGLSRLPLQRRGPEDHRAALLPSGQPRGRRSRGPQALPRGEARLDRRSALRRLGEGDAEVLRRRRHLRSDLPADELIAGAHGVQRDLGVQEAEHHPGFRVGARLHADLSQPDRPHPARRPRPQDDVARPARVLADRHRPAHARGTEAELRRLVPRCRRSTRSSA